MKKTFSIFLISFLSLTLSAVSLKAQTTQLSGNVYYTLPMTTFSVNVEVEVESFVPGPFAQYADKFFDSKAQTKGSSVCRIKSVSLVPYLEADYSKQYSVLLNPKTNAAEVLLNLTSQGYVSLSQKDSYRSANWKFGYVGQDDMFAGKGLDKQTKENVTVTYTTVETEDGSTEEIAETHKEIVNLTEPQKAEELAAAILDLKQKKIDIITGNTDAEFQGEAMGAVISELNRQVETYYTMFYGKNTKFQQSKSIDVIPEAGGNQQYTLFKISDTEGILPADSKSGRAVVMTISFNKVAEKSADNVSSKGEIFHYRTPANANVRILDGERLLMETRLPIFQLGAENTIIL